MKSAIYLIAVLCAAQVIDGVKDAVLTVKDTNHEDKTKRQLVLECSYNKEGATGTILTVKFKDPANVETDIYQQADGGVPTEKPVAGKLEDFEYKKEAGDNAKITLTVKKALAAQGTYTCVAGVATSPVVTVYASAEILTFDLKSDKEAAGSVNFAKGAELKGNCAWELPTGLTFVSLAVFRGGDKFLNVKSEGDNPLEKFEVKGIDTKKLEATTYDKDKRVLSVSIKDSGDDMKGVYKCQLNYKEGATDKPALEKTTPELKYTGAGSAAMASFLSVSSLLVLVVSYMKMF